MLLRIFITLSLLYSIGCAVQFKTKHGLEVYTKYNQAHRLDIEKATNIMLVLFNMEFKTNYKYIDVKILVREKEFRCFASQTSWCAGLFDPVEKTIQYVHQEYIADTSLQHELAHALHLMYYGDNVDPKHKNERLWILVPIAKEAARLTICQ